MTKNTDPNCETLGSDLMWGAEAIAEELMIDRRTVEKLVAIGAIPGGIIGNRVVVSRRRLREFFDATLSGGRPAA